MKQFLFLFFSLFLFSSIFAQTNVYEGIVIDEHREPVAFANIALLQLPDSAFISGTTTASNGSFSLHIDKISDSHRLIISFIGYITNTVKPQSGKMQEIVLKTNAKWLDEVVITGKSRHPIVEMKNGNIIFNVEHTTTTQGGNALDVLRKTPGLFVDAQNNISIGGRSGVLVVINGKQTYMQKSELISLLRTTSASSVAQVEVIHNPSVCYDAEGSAGIIHIKLKVDKDIGIHVSLNNSLVYSERWRDYSNASFNYNVGKLSLYAGYTQTLGSVNYRYGNTRTQSGKLISSGSDDTDKRQSVAGTLGVDYQFSGIHTAGIMLNGNYLFGPGTIWTNIDVRDAQTNTLQQTIYSVSNYYRQRENYTGSNLHYKFTPDKAQSFWFDADVAKFNGASSIFQPNVYRLPSGENQDGNTSRVFHDRDIQILALSGNAEMPLAKGVFTSGAKYSNVTAENQFDFYEVLSSSEVLNPDKSNTFAYHEQIVAAYLMYKRSIMEKISVDAGLRAEYTFSRGTLTPHVESTHHTEENPNDYFNLFPSLGVTLEFGKAHALSSRYGKRIGRPAYQNLNPFEQALDELSAWKGNPFLKPQITQKVSLNYVFKKTIIDISYSWAKDFNTQITDTVSLQRIVYIPKNIGHHSVFSINAVQQLSPTKWWRMSMNGNVYHQRNDLSLGDGRDMLLKGWGGNISVQNNFDLPFAISAELSGTYNTRRLGAAYETLKSTHNVDLGFKRNFMHDKCTAGLVFNDIFHGNRWDNYGGFGDFQIDSYGNRDSRQVKLNISFRIGSSKEKKEAHQIDLEEKGRL